MPIFGGNVSDFGDQPAPVLAPPPPPPVPAPPPPPPIVAPAPPPPPPPAPTPPPPPEPAPAPAPAPVVIPAGTSTSDLEGAPPSIPPPVPTPAPPASGPVVIPGGTMISDLPGAPPSIPVPVPAPPPPTPIPAPEPTPAPPTRPEPTPAPPTATPQPANEPDDYDAALAIADSNDPGPFNLPALQLEDPFDVRTLAATNPALKGGGALSAIAQACSDYGLTDAIACVAVAEVEGAGGGIGDNGTAYGPFQIHLTDGRLAMFDGKSRNNATVQKWAWTETGIRYAIRSMIATYPKLRGLVGHAAVAAIITYYERPADPRGEYNRARPIYDRLHGLGSAWASTAAPDFKGPAGQSSVDTTPLPPPPQPTGTKTPAGVNTAWGSLIDVYAVKVPHQHGQVKSLAASLVDIVKG